MKRNSPLGRTAAILLMAGVLLVGGAQTASGKKIVKFDKKPPQIGYADVAKANEILSAVISRDGRILATARGDKEKDQWYFEFWDLSKNLENPPLIHRFHKKTNKHLYKFGLSLALSGDGNTFAVLEVKPKKKGISVEILRRDGKLVKRITVPTTALDTDVFSPDNSNARIYCGLALDAEAQRLAICHKKKWTDGIPLPSVIRYPSVIEVFNVKSGKSIGVSPSSPNDGNYPPKVLFDYQNSLEFSQGGQHLSVKGYATLAKRDGTKTSRRWLEAAPLNWIIDANTLKTVADFGASRLAGASPKSGMDENVKNLDLHLPEELAIGADNKTYAAVNRKDGYWVGKIGKATQIKPFKTRFIDSPTVAINPLSFNSTSGFIVGAHGNTSSVYAFLNLIKAHEGKMLHLNDDIYTNDDVLRTAFLQDGKGILIVRQKSGVETIPMPIPADIEAKRLYDEGMEALNVGFEKQGGELLIQSVRSSPDYWKGMTTKFGEMADNGEMPLPVAGKVLLELISALKGSSVYEENLTGKYSILAIRAGHPGIARMAIARITTSSRGSPVAISALVTASISAHEGKPQEAYNLLLERLNTGALKNSAFFHLVRAPHAFKPLLGDPKKLAYILKKEESELPKPPEKGWAQVPFPDLNGNMIQPAVKASPAAAPKAPQSEQLILE